VIEINAIKPRRILFKDCFMVEVFNW